MDVILSGLPVVGSHVVRTPSRHFHPAALIIFIISDIPNNLRHLLHYLFRHLCARRRRRAQLRHSNVDHRLLRPLLLIGPAPHRHLVSPLSLAALRICFAPQTPFITPLSFSILCGVQRAREHFVHKSRPPHLELQSSKQHQVGQVDLTLQTVPAIAGENSHGKPANNTATSFS